MYRKRGKVRVMSTSRQLTLPKDCRFEPGDEIDIRWDDRCVLLTLPEAPIDEAKLSEAFGMDGCQQS